MAIAVATSRNTMATYYGTQWSWIGLATADPGTTATPSNEATGGSPAYARKQTTWGTATASVITGSAVTVDLPAGTYTFFLYASAATGNVMGDRGTITSSTLPTQGSLIVTPSYVQA